MSSGVRVGVGWRSSTTIQRCLCFGGLLIFVICLGWFQAHLLALGQGERKGSASDQTEMTAMHLFLPPSLLLFTQGAYHGHPFQTGMDWDSGCRVHVETENMTLLFGTSLVILTRDASVKVQYGPSQYRKDGSCCCVYCATFATNLVLALGRPVQSRIKTK